MSLEEEMKQIRLKPVKKAEKLPNINQQIRQGIQLKRSPDPVSSYNRQADNELSLQQMLRNVKLKKTPERRQWSPSQEENSLQDQLQKQIMTNKNRSIERLKKLQENQDIEQIEKSAKEKTFKEKQKIFEDLQSGKVFRGY
jgi:hypothetical protein